MLDCLLFFFFFREWENLRYFLLDFLPSFSVLGGEETWRAAKREGMPKGKKTKQTWKGDSRNFFTNLINIWFSIELLKKWIELLFIAMGSGSCVAQTSVAPGSNLISANTQDLYLVWFFPLKMQRLWERRLPGCAQHAAELGEKEGHLLKDAPLHLSPELRCRSLNCFHQQMPLAFCRSSVRSERHKWRKQNILSLVSFKKFNCYD